MSQTEPLRILLVDDEPSARTLLRRLIERNLEATVFEAEDGLQALESVAANKIELVVSDVSMPVLDGIELLRLLRTDPSWERLEVLMVSHVAAEDKISQIIALGASDYLLKPLQYDHAIKRLMAAAERILKDRPDSDSDAGAKPRVLIADPEADFRDSAERALQGEFSVKTARSLAEILVHLLRWKPTAVFVSPGISGLELDTLNTRIEALVGPDKPNFYRLDEPGSRLEPPIPGEGYAGAIRKSYVAATFASSVGELVLGVPRTARGLKPWADFLENELRTALYQTLGMMTGAEPEPVDEIPADQAPQIFGRLGIRADNELLELLVGVDATDGMAFQLAKAMLGDDIDEEFAIDGFKEVLNVVAGRLRVACAERRVEISMRLPEAHREEPVSEGVAAYRIDSPYSWNGEHFRIFLEVNELTLKVAGGSAKPEPVAAAS
ncbi:MAG: response regulator [Acidobacteria bacterium]|nr:response regulator [Acidobacteriota bacterium]